jgi:hypothetical protein
MNKELDVRPERRMVIVGILLVAFLVAIPCFASEVEVVFAEQKRISLSAISVTVVKAKSVSDDGGLRITGQLNRPHRLLLAGHLHAYTYTASNDLIVNSKYRVPGLNSQRKGVMRIPFNLLLKDASGASKVRLEYHSSGHQES